MHVTACLAGQKVDVEVGEDCRSLQALREAIVEALPQLCVEGFDVSVGGRALDDDEGIASLEENVCLDVSANSRGLSVLALREAGREVSEAGLLAAVRGGGDVALSTLYLDAGVPIDCVDDTGMTPIFIACRYGVTSVATLFLDRGSTAIDEKDAYGATPLLISCIYRHEAIATLLLDRGSRAIDEKDDDDRTPLHQACVYGHLSIATLLLDRGSTAIDEKDAEGATPLRHACRYDYVKVATLLLDRGSTAIDEKDREGATPLHVSCRYESVKVATLLLDRGSTAIDEKDANGWTPLRHACHRGNLALMTLLLDRGCSVDVQEYRTRGAYPQAALELLSGRGHPVLHDA